MNDTWKQTDPTIKKKKPTWKNTTVTYLCSISLFSLALFSLCNCAASQHHSATMQHHNSKLKMESPKLTILVKLKSQTICEKLNLTIDDPIMFLQENQLFSIFDFQIKFEIGELFRHWSFKSQMLSLKAYPQNFSDLYRNLSSLKIFRSACVFSFLFLLFRQWKSNDFHSSCCVCFSSFKMMFNLRNWEICEFWKPLQSLNLQWSINKKSE